MEQTNKKFMQLKHSLIYQSLVPLKNLITHGLIGNIRINKFHKHAIYMLKRAPTEFCAKTIGFCKFAANLQLVFESHKKFFDQRRIKFSGARSESFVEVCSLNHSQ